MAPSQSINRPTTITLCSDIEWSSWDDSTLESVDVSESLPLVSQIERTYLRARISALERALAERQAREQTLIDHYERLLDEQAETRSASTESSGFLTRLVGGR